jgi:hypothetical protein
MAIADFREQCRRDWIGAIRTVVGGKCPSSVSWRLPSAVASSLTPFAGVNHNFAFLPTGGGYEVKTVSKSVESGCLELGFGDGSACVVKPALLTLEYIADDPGESFLLLEADELRPSGVYKDIGDEKSETVVEVDPGDYLSYEIWERGYLYHGRRGREVPIPRRARLVTRSFEGRILVVRKGSLWNRTRETYDGRHNSMTSGQIRGLIERTIAAQRKNPKPG